MNSKYIVLKLGYDYPIGSIVDFGSKYQKGIILKKYTLTKWKKFLIFLGIKCITDGHKLKIVDKC